MWRETYSLCPQQWDWQHSSISHARPRLRVAETKFWACVTEISGVPFLHPASLREWRLHLGVAGQEYRAPASMLQPAPSVEVHGTGGRLRAEALPLPGALPLKQGCCSGRCENHSRPQLRRSAVWTRAMKTGWQRMRARG